MDQPLHPETLTWTALLGKWVEFAKVSVALPKDVEGEQWRASVVAIINLQAVTFALAEVGDLPEIDRPVALDRAEVLINDNQASLESIWADAMPDSVAEITRDARGALKVAQHI